MLNTLFGIYISDKYNAKSDIALWSKSIDASGVLDLNLNDAINGAALKSDLASLDYFITNYTMWTQNSIVQVEIKPDNESSHKIKTYALSQRISAPLIPPKYVQTDIAITLTETQGIADEVIIVLDIIKIPQTNTAKLIDLAKSLALSPDNIDIQTLGIQKQLIYTNKLLEALLTSQNVQLPSIPTYEEVGVKAAEPVCKRI